MNKNGGIKGYVTLCVANAEYRTTTITPRLTCEHAHDGSHDRTFTVRPMALTHVPSSDHLTTRTMLSLHRTTLA